MKILKRVGLVVLGLAVIAGCFYAYHVHIDYRFTEISKNKVFRSAVIPPKKIEKYLKKNNIKTVIDLRIGNTIDPLNPSLSKDISAEKKAVEAITGVQYVNIPSEQIPSKENLNKFYSILDKKENYPVLIHCYHGTGRAVLYSALYRVEYEDFSNEEARLNTRFPVFMSSFDNGTPKGEWLKNYSPRDN